MKKLPLALVLTSMIVLGACETHRTDAERGAVASERAAAEPAPATLLEGTAVEAPVVGLAGAVWSDPNNTGYVTGYTYRGQYHPGPPPGYNPATHSVEPGR